MGTTVLFLSKQRLLRESLQRVFQGVPEVTFMPPASTTEEAINSMLVSEPDVIMIDLNPSLFGLRVVKELRDACPACRIIVLSSHDDRIAEAQMAVAGVQGFLTKDIGIDELVEAVIATKQGEKIFGNSDLDHYVGRFKGKPALTMREAEVLQLIAKGYANKQVADRLGISIKTVEKHRQQVMEKLQAHETAGLSWRAFCLGVSPAS
jgi:DNA-binding NarL/FixJ family response regulator